jgi:hypothetical protein
VVVGGCGERRRKKNYNDFTISHLLSAEYGYGYLAEWIKNLLFASHP